MKASIIAVGSEMLTPFRVDTNSLIVTERLNRIGYDVRLKLVVGDSISEVAAALKGSLAWADLIVMIGGLGPTDDDLTRDAVARVLGVPFEVHEQVVERIRERFARRGMVMPDINRRQAMAPRGATLIDNPHGTAPGLWIEHESTPIVLLPGPPREMTPMIDAVIRDRLEARSGGRALFRRVLRITGRTESDIDTCAQPIYARWTHAPITISTTILAVMGQIELHLTALASNRPEADAVLDAAVQELANALGTSVYSTDGRNLEAVVGDLLGARALTLAVAESCTGGLLTSRLTDVPGSSKYVERGFVCYSNRAKVELLGVSEEALAAYGAVSEPVAQAMATGARTRARADVGIGVTGIAGPDGGTPEKPVGTVAVAVDVQGDVWVRTFQCIGGRDQVKFQASQAALNMLRLMLEHRDDRGR